METGWTTRRIGFHWILMNTVMPMATESATTSMPTMTMTEYRTALTAIHCKAWQSVI